MYFLPPSKSEHIAILSNFIRSHHLRPSLWSLKDLAFRAIFNRNMVALYSRQCFSAMEPPELTRNVNNFWEEMNTTIHYMRINSFNS